MNDETGVWLGYAEENINAARVLLNENLLNSCLQNAQQAAEKSLKACLIEKNAPLKKTHSIQELVAILNSPDNVIEITDDEIDLLDSVYLPSKYPLGSALPPFEPTAEICRQCLDVAERILKSVKSFCQKSAVPEGG